MFAWSGGGDCSTDSLKRLTCLPGRVPAHLAQRQLRHGEGPARPASCMCLGVRPSVASRSRWIRLAGQTDGAAGVATIGSQSYIVDHIGIGFPSWLATTHDRRPSPPASACNARARCVGKHGESPATPSASNQPASAISSFRGETSKVAGVARNTNRTSSWRSQHPSSASSSTVIAVSSRTSRLVPSATVSPLSMVPPGSPHSFLS